MQNQLSMYVPPKYSHARLALLTVVAAAATALVPASADARGNRARYTTDKEFGLGIMLGAPSGLSGKYYLDSGRTALSFGVGRYYQWRYERATHLHLDVLFHVVNLANPPAFRLPLYIGVGGRLLDHGNYDRNGVVYDDHAHVGVRVPFGIAFDFKRVPLDLFVEMALVFDFVREDLHDDTDFTGAMGLRYYF